MATSRIPPHRREGPTATPPAKHCHTTPSGLEVVSYVGDIFAIRGADAVVTGEGVAFEQDSHVTKTLIDRLQEFARKRRELRRKKGPFKLWIVRTTELSPGSEFKFVFHAMMTLGVGNWVRKMVQLYNEVLRKAEKYRVNTLVLPVLGTGRGNAEIGEAVQAIVTAVTRYKKNTKHLQKVYLTTMEKNVAETIITQFQYQVSLVCNENGTPKRSKSLIRGTNKKTTDWDKRKATSQRGPIRRSQRTFVEDGEYTNDFKKEPQSPNGFEYPGSARGGDDVDHRLGFDRQPGPITRLDAPSARRENGGDRDELSGAGSIQVNETDERQFNTSWNFQRRQESPYEERGNTSDRFSRKGIPPLKADTYKCENMSHEVNVTTGRHSTKINGTTFENGQGAQETCRIEKCVPEFNGKQRRGEHNQYKYSHFREDDSDVKGGSDDVRLVTNADSNETSSLTKTNTSRDRDTSNTAEGDDGSSDMNNLNSDVCPICIGPITDPKSLDKCGHVFCRDCIDNSFKHFKPVCPSCNMSYGIVTGTQPEGTMEVYFSGNGLPGHESYGTICVTYHFPDGIQGSKHPHPGQPFEGTTRRGFLPDSSEGKDVLGLLKTAFDRKLTFTIGRSTTTGQDNVVTWNDIHHKTRKNGGPNRFGYPDQSYLARVKDELARKGVTAVSTKPEMSF